jgi:hypothetical protein
MSSDISLAFFFEFAWKKKQSRKRRPIAPEEALARKVAGALRLPLAQVRAMVMGVFRWPLNKQCYLIASADICGRLLAHYSSCPRPFR